MRTTLDIDDDLLAAAQALAPQQGCSAGQVVSALLRRALAGGAAEQEAPVASGNHHGFRPMTSRGTPVTNTCIDDLRDAEGL